MKHKHVTTRQELDELEQTNIEQGLLWLSRRQQAYSGLRDLCCNEACCNTHTVNPDGSMTTGSTTSMSGYTIIEADTIEAALDAAKACPFLDINGSLEVSELIQMPG